MLHRPSILRRYARYVLALFVMSVLNMAIQIPVHAAMQQNMKLMSSMDHNHMADSMGHHEHSTMSTDCGCPPALCQSVDAQHDQLQKNPVSLQFLDHLVFYPLMVTVYQDTLHPLSNLSLQRQDWQYRQLSPPPIQLTTELQI